MLEAAVNGARLAADPAGALWWPEERTLIVADLHLEKASALARRGALLPPYDSRATLKALGALLSRCDPRTVIALGDSFHDRAGAERLDAGARDALRAFMAGRQWIWIAGNHDPAPPPDLGGEACESLEIGPLLFRHEPRPKPAPGEIAGHLHPAARLKVRGRSLRRRCFATDGARMVLPAFGALAGGLNVLDPAFRPLFATESFSVLVLGEMRAYRVSPSRLVAD